MSEISENNQENRRVGLFLRGVNSVDEAGNNVDPETTTSKDIPYGLQEDLTGRDELFKDNSAHEAGNTHRSGVHEQEWINDMPPWYYRGWEPAPQSENYFEKLHNVLLDRDAKQCNAWKEEVQNLLILAGLFSAIVTAFIIESYRMLQPDPNDKIISLLSRIVDHMSIQTTNSSTDPASLPTVSAPTFAPTPSGTRVNIFWFISLVLSLTVALIGIITLQWLREHQLYENGMEAMKTFAIFNARKDGLKRWYVPQIFASLPLLLQTAIVLFFVGLIDFLFSIRIQVAIPVSAAIAVPMLFLVTTTILPTLQLYSVHLPYFLRVNDHAPAPCPYKSPQALIFRRAAVASEILFNLSAAVFGALCIPWVAIIRLFAVSSQPFYGKHAPFGTGNDWYQLWASGLRDDAGSWIAIDTEWLAARTSYAVAFYHPRIDCRHLAPFYYFEDVTAFTSFYDCIAGMKGFISNSDPTNDPQGEILSSAMQQMLRRLSDNWVDPLERASRETEIRKALEAHFSALRGIISSRHRQHLHLSPGDMSESVYESFLNALLYESGGSRALRARLHLSNKVESLFCCSNLPGVMPTLSLSARRLLAHRRGYLERQKPPWMNHRSRDWTRTLKNMILDAQKFPPRHPFTQRCNGTPNFPCSSNLHTESIIELTEFILIFQVPDDIRDTLHLLHDLIKANPKPVLDAPFVLIIGCAYLNAVANVNQDDKDEFRMLLNQICDLCGSLDPTVEGRPGGSGRHWPKIESAFDYVRSNCLLQRGVPAENRGHRPVGALRRP